MDQIEIHTLSLSMANVYVIENQQGLVLVDAGMPGNERQILSYINRLNGKKLALIFITHAHLDHYGAAAALKRATGAPVAVHHLDAPAMRMGETALGSARGRGRLLELIFPLVVRLSNLEPAVPDIVLDDQQELSKFGFPAQVIHTPGHTPGSSTFWVGERYAFAGDLVTNTRRVLTQQYFATDWSQLKSSVNRLRSLNPDLTYPGHGRHPIKPDEIHALV